MGFRELGLGNRGMGKNDKETLRLYRVLSENDRETLGENKET
jgi:hypothetical protein